MTTNNINYHRDSIVGFPTIRLRRLRKKVAIRDLVQEVRLSVKDLICPIFIQEGIKKRQVIESMPGIERLPINDIIDEVQTISDLGIQAIILFGIPVQKDTGATSAFDDKGIIQRATELIRKHFGDKIVIITDVCLCQYTSHGHCGILINEKINNDASLEALTKVAVSHAKAGADMVAPSAMMDGQVKAIRHVLDENSFADTIIMGYSAKQASSLYTPFRGAANCVPEFGDRKTYQMPFTNSNEAMHEIELDIKEGADIIMIKPAIPYLDLIYRAKNSTNLPVCAYSVSGEYALIKAAAYENWINESAVMTEFLTSIKRAGADMMITYHAKEMAKLLNK
ncbi:MAG TPA: porphobilinogen synthase [Nitrososphaeraceae archaeon]|jgi:porphobilinogen synthase|nr:porphobilinogen synthase [Nitrososphaeraceae archaeon]